MKIIISTRGRCDVADGKALRLTSSIPGDVTARRPAQAQAGPLRLLHPPHYLRLAHGPAGGGHLVTACVFVGVRPTRQGRE